MRWSKAYRVMEQGNLVSGQIEKLQIIINVNKFYISWIALTSFNKISRVYYTLPPNL